MSLFGSLGSSQPQSSNSLFGGLANNNNNNNSGNSLGQSTPSNTFGGNSLFSGGQGQAASQQGQAPNQTASSLFGGSTLVGSSQTQGQPQGPSLFGQQPQTQQQTNAGTAGSLFGKTQAPQQPSTSAEQSVQPAGGSVFGGSILNNGRSQDPLKQSQRPTGLFMTLTEQAEKRRRLEGGERQGDGLPTLQLGLNDIASKIRRINGAGVAGPPSKRESARARDLLAASGVPRGSTVRHLRDFGATIGSHAPPPAAVDDLDVDAFVANSRAKSTQDLIDESLEQTRRDFNVFLEENIQLNWQQQRQRIHEHFGIARPAEELGASLGGGEFGRSTRGAAGAGVSAASLSFGASTMSKSILGGSLARGPLRASLFTDVAEKNGSSPGPSSMDDPLVRGRQEKYAAKVHQLNAARKQGVVYPVVEEFARVELEAESDSTEHLVDAYRALKTITRENGDIRDPSELGAVRERQYAQDYLEENAASARATEVRRRILDGSRKFLEDSFFDDLESIITRNPQEASLGGVPSKINKVRALVRIKAARKDLSGEGAELQMLGDDYCWALIYHLLRCGLVAEAADYVSQNQRAFKSLDPRFPNYMSAFARDPDRRLPREMQTRINAEYSQRVKLAPENSIDPYRMACYKIVGRCDLAHKNIEDISMQMKDWIWLLFSLAREVNRVEETAGDYFGLDDARALIEQIGQRHFASGAESSGAYATFFLMQILAGLFEKAVFFLYPHNYVAAVHFAITLDFYGLLRVSDAAVSESDLLTYTTRAQPQINFGRMVGYYTRDFRLARAEAATDYLILICLNSDLPGAAGESHSMVCQHALRELVLETREFALLLGDIRSNGQRIPGAIQERLPLINLHGQEDFLRTLTLQSASVADDSGRVTDAVLLYHLAEDYDKVVVVVNRTLSDALAVQLGQGYVRLEPLKPRKTDDSSREQQQQQQQRQSPNRHADSSLSLTSVDDPTTLAQNMISLYDANALYFNKIRETNRAACGQLLRMAQIRAHVEQERDGDALDAILDLGIVPIRANGNTSVIRSAAQSFNTLPQVVARVIGNLLIWTIKSLGRQRERLNESAFAVNRNAGGEMLQAARDIMVFAGLIKYKLPADIFDMLARSGQSVGV